MPGERYQLLLAHLYARNRSGELALGAGSDLDTLLTALAHHGVPAQRIRELRDLVVRSTSVDGGHLLALLADPTRRLMIGALRDPRFLEVELIDHLAASVSEVDRQISSVPFARLQLLLAPSLRFACVSRTPNSSARVSARSAATLTCWPGASPSRPETTRRHAAGTPARSQLRTIPPYAPWHAPATP
ncbi:MAG: hypothetical protein ACRDRX_16035 [Pseudonocardiaceae bacterium]